ncbi:MAG: hypothetical protein L6R37_007667 [Teloschistes peruensis]|nr:MAG: hypothetical protein L6R37_007667 [Teloschistes peruensis]
MNDIEPTYKNDVVGNHALQAAAKKEEMERRWDVTKYLSRRLPKLDAGVIPSIAVTFDEVHYRNEAMMVLLAHNLDLQSPIFEAQPYNKSASLNTLWNFKWTSRNPHGLVRVAKEMLPSTECVPT